MQENRIKTYKMLCFLLTFFYQISFSANSLGDGCAQRIIKHIHKNYFFLPHDLHFLVNKPPSSPPQ